MKLNRYDGVVNYLCICLFACMCISYSMGAEVPMKDGESIAFLGDSITQKGNDKPFGYIHLVLEGLREAGVEDIKAIPAGKGGHTTRDMLKRIDKDVMAHKPIWMTLNSGINDVTRGISLEEFETNVRTMIEKAQQAGIKVILMTPTIARGEDWKATDNGTKTLLEYCGIFRKIAKEKDLILVDLNAMIVKEYERMYQGPVDQARTFTEDGCHFNGVGNMLLAAEILRTLNVPESVINNLREKWNAVPGAICKPSISMSTYIKLNAIAEKNGSSLVKVAEEIVLKNSEKGNK